jgi:predicted ATP-grasp superfamily ATP-dependent carboligase/cation diffusion facilitator CzcD-associated flavoprotein CzcO
MTNGKHAVDTTTPALVLKFDPNLMHHGTLGVIRSLGRVGVPVYGVLEGPWTPAASSRYLAGRFFWRPGAADVDRILTGLLRLAEHIGRPSVLISTDDASTIFLAENGSDLRRWFFFPAPASDLPRRLAGKYSLYQMCRDLGMPCPETILPSSLVEARQFASAAGYPLIVKLTTPWTSRLRSTSVVASQEELDRRYDTCARAGAGLMLQEFIPGGQGHDWFFHGYCDADSVCQPAFTGIKDRSYPAGAGLTSLGRSVANENLRSQIASLLARVGYRGLLDLDIRLDARDGQYNLLDFNPRLGAQFRVFRDTAGSDVALAAYLDLTGQAIPPGEQVNERRFLVENYDPLSALANWRRGELGLRSWVSSLRTVDETAWFARDDLRPFGLMCARMSWRMATRPFVGDRKPTSSSPFRYRPGRAASGTGHALTVRPAVPRPQKARPQKGGNTKMRDAVDVAIIGAGPYGLSLAAHLRAAGVEYRHFGMPMRLWQAAMPQGMFLKSQGFASNLSDPEGTHTLEAFCKATSRRYASYGLPVPLDTFVSYGQWFQSGLGLAIDEVLVTNLALRDGGFELHLGGIDRVLARKVVVAVGVEHFAYVPDYLSELPSALCTHSSAHTDLAAFRGKEVIVVGAGQSALESAALLHENGASVQVIARKREIAWNGEPLPLDRPLLQRLREPEAGLGSGLTTWFYSNHPDLFRQLPRSTRVYRARTALGPAGACWLRSRVEGQFAVQVSHTVTWAKSRDGRVHLGVKTPDGTSKELEADHVIAATGYRTDLTRLPFLPEAIRAGMRSVAGSPAVGRDYQSAVSGLYFVGPAVAPTFGPVMRFVFGTWHAAPAAARHLGGVSGRKPQHAAAASR